MRNKLVLLFVILLVFLFGHDVKAESDKAAEQTALKVANEWLQLVDNAKYDESWNSAAEFFKSAVVRDSWQQTLKAFRSPLGKIISRKVKSKEFTRSLPGVPDGQYVVIKYETSFENKKSAIETVTPMLDKDGKWRVSGYYIK
ncbi:MAG: DUF4019 domain-containing protein [Nitrospirota bacterium]